MLSAKYRPFFHGLTELNSPGNNVYLPGKNLEKALNFVLSKLWEPCVWDGTTFPFPNFNRAIVEVWEWINDSQSVISKHCHGLSSCMSTSFEIALRGMPQNTFDDKSTLVQVMAWCHLATSHYLS